MEEMMKEYDAMYQELERLKYEMESKQRRFTCVFLRYRDEKGGFYAVDVLEFTHMWVGGSLVNDLE
jgi:hypothetical protein